MVLDDPALHDANTRSRSFLSYQFLVKTLYFAAMMSTLSATVIIFALFFDDSTSGSGVRRSRRRMPVPIYTYNTSLFPNSSGPFNRTFGIGGRPSNRPKSPLSSLGGIFTGAGGGVNNTSGNIGNFAFNSIASETLLEADFGSEFPVEFGTSPKSSQSPTNPPSRPPSRPPSKQPTKQPTQAPVARTTSLPTVADQNAVTVCIAVIDESSQPPSFITTQWDALRAAFPKRPFCLLQPNLPGGFPLEAELFRPVAFDNDPLTTFSFVNRQNTGNASAFSDWYQICKIDAYRRQGLNRVSLFVDTSGSLVEADVSLSISLFQQNVAANGINSLVDQVQNESEDWIEDCINASVP
jgi:hypothetical protein